MTYDSESRPPVPPRNDAHPLDGVTPHPAIESHAIDVQTLVADGVVLYISGPMTGIPQFNYPFFEQVRNWFGSRGVKCVSPTDVDGGAQVDDYSEEKPYGYYLTEALRLQLTATAWIGLPGWTKSKGAKREFDIALDLEHRTFLWTESPDGSFYIQEIL